MESRELPACAALVRRQPNGFDLIVAGRRHGDCLSAINSAGLLKQDWEQGFMTTNGRFVSRLEALDLRLKAGLPSASPDGYRKQHGLFSEDLY